MDVGELGWKFFLGVIGVCIVIGVAGVLFFGLAGAAFYAWGPFGALLFISGLGLLWGWVYDRRHKNVHYD